MNCGLKQGYPLSPLLFNIFINELTVYLKSFDLGIAIGGEKACILLYADDIALLANTESDLQKLLEGLYTWCNNNNMTINAGKSNVVHLRLPSMERSKYIFKCGDINIELINYYTYLGLNLNEFLDFNLTAKIVAKSANRALGLVMAKCKTIGGVSYDVLKKLFDSLVSPIIEYGAAIWGYKSYSYINSIQLRACRFFLGVGRYTPNAAVMSDMGWIPIYHTQWKIISSQWCKLINMEQNRMNRKMFAWADDVSLKSKRVRNWTFVVRKHFTDLELEDYCNLSRNIDKRILNDLLMSKMFFKYTERWHINVNAVASMTGNGRNKLRTYKLFNPEYGVENYCKC